MASIDTGGHGGKKSVDQEIPLVPFIDLLLCCVMFLLVTAVWNQLARLEVNQPVSGAPSSEAQVAPEPERLFVQVTRGGFTVSSTLGTAPTEIAMLGERYDTDALGEHLRTLREVRDTPSPRLSVSPDDDIAYRHVITAMDAARGAGFGQISLQRAPR